MSFLQKIEVLAKKKTKQHNLLRNSEDIDRSLKTLEKSRVKLLDVIQRNVNPESPAYRHALNKFREHWFDFYHFRLEPKQEQKYIEVLKDKSEPDPVEETVES